MRKIALMIAVLFILTSCNKDDENIDIAQLPKTIGVAMNRIPWKIKYIEGDSLDLTGLIVNLIMDNNDTLEVRFEDFKSNGISCYPNNKFVLEHDTMVNIVHIDIDQGTNFSISVTPKYISDIDGNKYSTIVINHQVWMKENLMTTKLNDGTEINLIIDNTTWSNTVQAAYCWYNNDLELANKNNYGALYNWYTLETEKLCPIGWHVAKSKEWNSLQTYLWNKGYGFNAQTQSVAKAIASEDGWLHTEEPGAPGNNPQMNNKSGLSIPAGGYRVSFGNFYYSSKAGRIWCIENSTEALYLNYDSWGAWQYTTEWSTSDIKAYGYSVRCIKD